MKPTQYTEELAEEICDRLSKGESMHKLCDEEDMPKEWRVYDWLKEFPDFLKKYAHAREIQAERLAQEIIEIADSSDKDIIIGEDGKIRTDWENVQRSRLRVDARKWVASKLLPKKYGDKMTNELTGLDGEPLFPSWMKK